MVTLAKGHMSIVRHSPLKLLGQFELNYICSLAKGKGKFMCFRPGHMTKMATMPIFGKTLKSLLFQINWVDCLETLCVISKDFVL